MTKKTELEAVDRMWCRDIARKELFLCNSSSFSRLRMRLFGRRTKVEYLYRWVQEWMAGEEGILFDNVAIRDSIHLHGVPRKYQLEGGWSIRDTDLPFLSHGPLLAADGITVLVPAYSLLDRTIVWLKVLAALISLVVAVVKGIPILLS